MNVLDKQLIDLIKNNIINMNEYKNLMNLDLLNIRENIDLINRICINQDIKKLILDVYKNMIKEKDGKIMFKNKILINRILNQSLIEFTLNQKSGIDFLIRFLTNKVEKICGLFGYAGTGKTTIIIELIYILLKNKYIKSVIFTAPTNKALNVMKTKFAFYINKLLQETQNFDENEKINFEQNLEKLRKKNIIVEFATIHRLMKYKTEFNMDGEMMFIKDKDSLLENFDLVIIDECSMVSINLIYEMLLEIEKINKKIIFLGDPAQLPPVNEKISSIFMNDKNIIQYESLKKYIMNPSIDSYNIFCKNILNMDIFVLKEIIRTKNISIINACNLIRDWIIDKNDFLNISQFIDDNFTIYPFDKTVKVLTDWYKQFEESIKINSDSIIITWTNDETNKYNDHCRKILFKKSNLDKFVIGDILILNEFYNINSNKFNTSEKIIVKNIENIEYKIENLNDKINKTIRVLNNHKSIEGRYKKFIDSINILFNNIIFKLYKLKILKLDDNKEYDIMVLFDEEKEKHKNVLTNIMEEIKTFRNSLLDITQLISLDNLMIQPLWREFYSKFIDPFASVSYGYAITCHKAQGSNYKNVFVDFSDISKNKNDDEMKRCMYTAMSRTIDKLHILI